MTMKKMLFSLMLLSGVSYGAQIITTPAIYQSTFSATSQFDRPLCGQGYRGFLHSVCVVDAVASSTVAVFNSSYAVADVQVAGTQNLSGTIDSSEVKPCMMFDTPAARGLYVDQFGPAGVVIHYDCFSN